MMSATLRHWRALPRRVRLAAVPLAMLTVWMAVGSVLRWRGDTWPARTVLRAPEWSSPLGFSPDGRTFLTYGHDGITPWDLARVEAGPTWAFRSGEHPEVGVFSPDGRTYVAGVFAYPGPLSIALFDTATGRIKATLPTSRRTIAHLAFDPDGRTVRAFLGDDHQLKECSSWNPAFSADLLEVVTLDAAAGLRLSSRPLTAPTRMAITTIAPDGRTLAIADRTGGVQLWDLDRDQTLGNLTSPAPLNPVLGAGLGFSDDGQTLAIGRMDSTVELWDVASRRLLKTLPKISKYFVFTMIRFSPDGRTIALTGYRSGDEPPLKKAQDHIRQAIGLYPTNDPELVVLDVATGRRLGRAADSTRPFFSPDGRTLATGEPDGSTRLRDIPGP